MDDDDIKKRMEEADRDRVPTEDDHDPDMDRDDRMFHPDQVSRLAEDGARPAEPAHDVLGSGIQIDHPQTDSNMDMTELYDVGSGNASGANTTEDAYNTPENIVDEDDEDQNARFR